MRKKLFAAISLSIGALFILAAGQVLAAGESGSGYASHSSVPIQGLQSWYLSPMFVYTHSDSKRDSDWGRGGTLRIGKILSEHFNAELSLSGSHFPNDPSKWDTFSAGLHGLFFFTHDLFNSDTRVAPFLDLGAAFVRSRAKIPGATHYRYHNDPVFNADLGTNLRLNDYGLKLRIEAGYQWTLYNGGSHEVTFGEPQVLAGLVIPLGKQQPRQVQTEPRIMDSDHDGVEDNRDECPNTPAGAQVNASGCALDTDNDGVPNYQDQCRNTPQGVSVDDKGCTLDSDNDGVPDYKDQCPNTKANLQVDKHGCVVEATRTLEDVHFATDSSRLTQDSRESLDNEAELLQKELKRSPDTYALVNGYTDSVGAASYNKKLSQERADSVRTYLIGQGVDSSRLKAVGHGEENPVASNKTAAGRLQNRRVSVSVQKQSVSVPKQK